MVGKTLGHYEVREPLGSGGMGDVYRAHDTNLHRDVAIKVLPADLADDPQRLARLKREAHLLAALNHPNIATIHGFEESGGTSFLVLELVRGETLEQRLAAGRLPVNEALAVCGQIATAIEAAHEAGIIHRDLKPANVLITPDGRAKVLDFGVAKAVEPTDLAADHHRTSSPDVGLTRTGVILGTAPYMSPEQLRGRALDARADIWAFGCVLYEALTGTRAFNRETIADTLAATLEAEPPWDLLPEETPVLIQSLLRRCLRKDASRRLHAIADARTEIEQAIGKAGQAPVGPSKEAERVPLWQRALPWGAALLMATLAVAALYSARDRSADRAVRRFQVAPPPGERLRFSDDPGTAVSPDGSHIAYMTGSGLFIQAIDETEARVIPGTASAHSPFFSPDGEWVGFFDDEDRTLKKAPVPGGPVQVVCEAPGAHAGASWGPDEMIVFSSVGSGLGLASSPGDAPQSLTTADAAAGELRHEYPEILPNGEGVLFTIEREDSRAIAVLDLDTLRYEAIIPAGTGAHYAPTGHVVYGQGGSLMAIPFDQGNLEVTGAPFQLRERVKITSDGSLEISFSRDGMLVFAPPVASTGSTKLVWADREGEVTLIFDKQGTFNEARLSPDGGHVALHGDDDVLWAYDIDRDVLSVVVSEGKSVTPTWSSDGSWVYYSSRTNADSDLYRAPVDRSGPAEPVLSRERDQYLPSVSPDGSALLYAEVDAATGFDIWTRSFVGDANPVPIVQTSGADLWPQFSPDGAWFAYVSDVSGLHEVYVRSFPGPGRRWQLSNGGGSSPRWSRDGRALFYSAGPRVMRVDIAGGADGGPSAAKLVFENDSLALQDVAPDGRFLMIERPNEPPTYLNVVLNWFEELRRAPADGSR